MTTEASVPARPSVSVQDLVMVVLVRDESRGPLPTHRVRDLPDLAAKLRSTGIYAIKLFSSATPDPQSRAQLSGDLMIQAITEIRNAEPDLTVITETCMCSYTHCGECYLPNADGTADLPGTIEALAVQAVTQAEAGAAVVGPAAMIPGSVRAIKEALTGTGFDQVEVMPHLIFRSWLYGGYRSTMEAAPISGERRFQVPPYDAPRAVRTGLGFIEEGADSLLLEPALFCTDVLAELRRETQVPLLPFSVSGEYTHLPPEVLYEEYLALRRAGASQIITYAAADLAEVLADQAKTR